tara:strand:+ start:397 stop:636 length:240 start_codon:yes stop_codon:yes gene_type:complete
MKGNKKMTNEVLKEVIKTDKIIKSVKNDLINNIDVLFYDVENIETQASIFRTILNQFCIGDLKAIKYHIQLTNNKKERK